MMKNIEIRRMSQESGVKMWEIAEKLGMTPERFSVKLRHELEENERNKVLDAIAQIKAEKGMKRELKLECLPWLSQNRDCREIGVIKVGISLLQSKKFNKLTAGARILYLCMAMESCGRREFQFTHGSAKKYGLAKASYDRYVKELKKYGFISAVPDKDLRQYAPGRYRFEFGCKLHDETIEEEE